MKARQGLLLVTLALLGPWCLCVADYNDYMHQFSTLGNSTVYDDELPRDEGRVAFAWSGLTGPGHPDFIHDVYDDGYQPEKAHPDFIWDNCAQLDNGEVVLNGTRSCHLMVTGFDVHADLLTGGLDGLYLLLGCYEGKALYVRKHSPMGEERSLWFSPMFGDWQIMLGPHPADSDMVVYSNYGQLSPLDVDGWHLSADYNSIQSQYLHDNDDLYYKLKGIKVVCDTDAVQQAGRQFKSVGNEYDKCDPRDPTCVTPPPSPAQKPSSSGSGAGGVGAAASPPKPRGVQRRKQRA